MNRDTIKKTAVSRVDKKEGVYIVESPLLDIVFGAAKDEDEAWKIFDDLVDACYIAYLEGKKVGQYKHRGRPAKHGVAIHAQIKQSTKNDINALSQSLGISQGEAIDYLTSFHKAKATQI